MAQLRREEERLSAIDVEVVVVGNGAPHFIEGFREEARGYRGTIVTDPSRGAYALLEMKRPRMAAAPMTLLRAAQAFAQGHRQVKKQGDASQLGGVVIVRPDGEITFRKISDYAGDHPPIDDVIAAMEQAARA